MPNYTQGESAVVFQEGDYDFVVLDAGEKESASGNTMIEMELVCTDGEAEVSVTDQLVFVKKAFWKIDDFRRATGEKLVPGQKVSFEAEDCIERKGRCHLIVDTYNGRSKNKIGGYIVPIENQTVAAGFKGSGGDGAAVRSGVAASKNEFGEPAEIPF